MTVRTITTSDSAPLDELIGEHIIVRTVTHYYTGLLKAYDDKWLILEEAAWIPDTGRWSAALANGTLTEVEPYPGKCYVAIGAIVDVAPWVHALPRTVKG